MKKFAEEFPDRFCDVGIAEEHAVDYALGLSLKGYKPVVAIYSTFLQRGFDQLVHDVGIARGKVLFCLDRSGLVPGDGETHQGIFDISYLRMIPNFTIMFPSCREEFVMMLNNSLENIDSPLCIRYPKDIALDYKEYNPKQFSLKRGEGVVVSRGGDFILVSTGTLLGEAISAKNKLKSENIKLEVYNLRYAKPISDNITDYLSRDSRPVLIIEEGVYNGGISEFLINEILMINKKKIIDYITIPDEFPTIGTRKELLDYYSLTAGKIRNKILNKSLIPNYKNFN